MKLAEQIEKGPCNIFLKKSKSTMRYRKFLKKVQHRAWRRFKEDLKPLYKRYSGYEL